MEASLRKADSHLHPFEYQRSKEGMRHYVKRAAALGFDEICFTEHCPLPAGYGTHGMTEDELERYIRFAPEVQQEFPAMQIRLGLEVDYHPAIMTYMEKIIDSYAFDYILGSIHLHTPGYTDMIDGKPFHQVVDMALQLTREAALSGLFDVIAHLDFFRRLLNPVKFGQFTGIYSPEAYQEPIMELLQIMEKKRIGLDVNSSGLRKFFTQILPCPDILGWAANLTLIYTFGSDAHDVKYVGAGYDVMRVLAPSQREALVTFCQRKPISLLQC